MREFERDIFQQLGEVGETTEKEMPNAFHGLGMASQANVYAKIMSFIETHNRFSVQEVLKHVLI